MVDGGFRQQAGQRRLGGRPVGQVDGQMAAAERRVRGGARQADHRVSGVEQPFGDRPADAPAGPGDQADRGVAHGVPFLSE
jgi:hypothetical protein